MTAVEDIATEPLARAKQLATGVQEQRRALADADFGVTTKHMTALNELATEACAHALIAVVEELRTANLIAYVTGAKGGLSSIRAVVARRITDIVKASR